MTDPADPPPPEKPAKPALRNRPGGLANANLTSKGGVKRSERSASARSASKSKPWMSR